MPRAQNLRTVSQDIRQHKDGTYTIRVFNDRDNRWETIRTSDLETGTRLHTRKSDVGDKIRVKGYETQVQIHMETREFTKTDKRTGKTRTFKKQVFTGYDVIHGAYNGQTTRQRRHVLYDKGDDRLDNGFETLLSQMRWGGVDSAKLDRLRDIWDFLSDKQKAEVYSRYRTSAEVLTYGSSAISEYERDFGIDAESYYRVIYNLVQKVTVGN